MSDGPDREGYKVIELKDRKDWLNMFKRERERLRNRIKYLEAEFNETSSSLAEVDKSIKQLESELGVKE